MLKWLSEKHIPILSEKMSAFAGKHSNLNFFPKTIAIVRTCQMKQSVVLQVFSMAMDLRHPPMAETIGKNLFGVTDTELGLPVVSSLRHGYKIDQLASIIRRKTQIIIKTGLKIVLYENN